MADSADLVVLGAWYGSGNRGGKISIFLMGCYDQNNNKWKTVTKVHTGHDDGKKLSNFYIKKSTNLRLSYIFTNQKKYYFSV